MIEDNLYIKAEKKVDEKIKFYRHLFSYVFVISILFVINYLFTPNEWWFLWVALFWGIGVLFNYIGVFILEDKFDELYKDNMIKKEMEKMKR
jgi:uncharacterized membrane protein YdbT with pleckstrin-like domain